MSAVWAFIKKYFKLIYVFIAAIVIVGVLVLRKFFIGSSTKEAHSEEADKLKETISDIKEKTTEIRQQTEIEIAVAKSKDTAVQEKLKEIVKIEDDEVRRQQLLDLYNSMQNTP